MVGDSPFEQTVQLPKLLSAPKRVLINYDYDVLDIENYDWTRCAASVASRAVISTVDGLKLKCNCN